MMTAPKASPGRPVRRAWRRRLVAAAVALFGLFLLGDGLYIKAKASVAQILLERAWADTLETEQPVRPWAWIDTWPVARVSVPRLNRSAIVLHGTSGQAMAFGPGLMADAAPPGSAGLAVMSAHRDTHFRFLQDIKRGDEVQVETADGVQHRFRIIDLQVVEADQSGLTPDYDEALIALTTCWPFNTVQSGNKRFVAIGRLMH